jgi:hypothetical protein
VVETKLATIYTPQHTLSLYTISTLFEPAPRRRLGHRLYGWVVETKPATIYTPSILCPYSATHVVYCVARYLHAQVYYAHTICTSSILCARYLHAPVYYLHAMCTPQYTISTLFARPSILFARYVHAPISTLLSDTISTLVSAQLTSSTISTLFARPSVLCAQYLHAPVYY